MPRFLPLLLVAALSFPFASHSETHRNVSYGPAPDQRYDLYTPAGGARAPLILMVHGGGWQRGDKNSDRVVENKRARWVPQGLAFATSNYRMQPDAPPVEQARDIARALADLQKKARQFDLDVDNMVLMGHSAGGHLIALLAARPELLSEAGARPPRGYVVLDSGALDVPEIMNRRHFRLYDRAFGNNPADWTAASPYHQLRHAVAPMLMVCSTRRADACPQARNFSAKARTLGGQADVLPLDKTHGEINAQLGEAGDYTSRIEAFLSGASTVFAEHLGR